jgi:glycosyltransferase involved in cell wall biosynthesis
MRIGIIAPPFIAVPPARYGGTELFIANLVEGLTVRGHDVTLYANGDSRVPCTLKSRYRHTEWPVVDQLAAQLKNADHTAWAVHDAAGAVDVLHLNDALGVPLTRFIEAPSILTLHHAHEPALTALYQQHPQLEYVAISRHQARQEPMPRVRVVHHGIAMDDSCFREDKEDYVAFLGRIAPCKGAHLAIEAARRAGVRLKIAAEIQPLFRQYWDDLVRPHIDGRQIEYVGEADRGMKNEILGRARALLFPIQWDEPFGLVMIEAMACGTPVLALPGGSVDEIVRDGVSGWICRDVADMAARIAAPPVPASSCRDWAAERFSVDRMVNAYLDIYEDAVVDRSTAAALEDA